MLHKDLIKKSWRVSFVKYEQVLYRYVKTLYTAHVTCEHTLDVFDVL